MNDSHPRIGRLVSVTAAFWLLAAGPAWLLAGARGLEGLTYATLLCAVPGAATLWLASGRRGGQQLLAGVVIGMGLRMGLVLAGALVLRSARPDLGLWEFHAWLILAYLVTLAAETQLVLKAEHRSRLDSPAGRHVMS